MKLKTTDLSTLMSVQELIIENRKLEQEAKRLTQGTELEAARAAQHANSAEISQARVSHEALIRELNRIEADLALVAKREATDRDRLTKTAVARDALGIQHELETLGKRRSDLEDAELEILDRKQESDQLMHQLEAESLKLESELALTKTKIQLDLDDLKKSHHANTETLKKLRSELSEELLRIFDSKLLRGLAVGKLQKNSCTACNMGITATALADLHNVPADELAYCPECQAILIR